MKKARLIAGVTATIPVAVGGFAAPAAAHAAQATTALAHQVPAKGKTVLPQGMHLANAVGPRWAEVSVSETLWFRSGGSWPHYRGQVYATCYYRGNTGYSDPYWDHFTKWLRFTGHGTIVSSRSGHVADSHVDFNGQRAPLVLPHC